ncbi:conserved hypothetical protein [uncultured Desulfatiglans sp.]|nr:conserved hypothetical protein [uncultured Desulfatiglans sp.]
MQIPSLPFKILAIAPFRGTGEAVWRDAPITVDPSDLDRVLAQLKPALYIPLPKELCPAGGLDLAWQHLKSFHPDTLIQTDPFLKALVEAKAFAAESSRQGVDNQSICSALAARSHLPPIHCPDAPISEPRGSSTGGIDKILEMVALPGGSGAPDTSARSITAVLDDLLSRTLQRIFTDPSHQALEGSWRGLKLLLGQGAADGTVEISLLPAAAETLAETIELALDHLIASPPSVILLDLPCDSSPSGIERLERTAALAETLLSPAVCWIGPRFLHLEDWGELDRLAYLPHTAEGPEFAKWRRFQQESKARWLALTCNRLPARFPYGPENPPRTAAFEEKTPPWIAPVWGLASLLVQSLHRTGWPTAFTQWQRIRLEDQPLHAIAQGRQIPTEMPLSEERLAQFIRTGILPLMAARNQDVVFTPAETTAAGTSLAYQLFVSRITQVVLWCKDHFPHGRPAPATLENDLKTAFSRFWERTGHRLPDGFTLTVSSPEGEDRPEVLIDLLPPRSIVPSGERVTLQFPWS